MTMAKLDTTDEAFEAASKVMDTLQYLGPQNRARVLLLVLLEYGPQAVSDEALLELCHAAQKR